MIVTLLKFPTEIFHLKENDRGIDICSSQQRDIVRRDELLIRRMNDFHVTNPTTEAFFCQTFYSK